MSPSSPAETLERLRAILDAPRTPGWDNRARVDAISAFVDYHRGPRFGQGLTITFVELLIETLEHELEEEQ